MLKNINPILSPDLLYTLRSMGHGDEIAIVDGNYPADDNCKRLARLDGMNFVPVLDAILSVLPIDDFTDEAIFRSTVKEDTQELHSIHHEILNICKQHHPTYKVIPLVGEKFHERVRDAYCVVSTSEPSLYANVILRKGVIYP